MDRILISATSLVTEADVSTARLGKRFGRLDLASQLVLLAVEKLSIDFDVWSRDRIGICLAAQAGSLATDFEYWRGRDLVGGPSPTLFAYTLPSAAIGEVAIRHRLTGPNLCVVGEDNLLIEARDWLQRAEVDACLGIFCTVITPAIAEMIQAAPIARAGAVFLQRGNQGQGGRELRQNDRDIAALCTG